MKYLVLIAYRPGGWEAASEAQRAEWMDDHNRFHQTVGSHILAGEALGGYRALPAKDIPWNSVDCSLTEKPPAGKAGIRAGDRVVQVAGLAVHTPDDLRSAVLLADSPAEFVLAGPNESPGRSVRVELAGAPVRVGISWRYDDAEPGVVIISRVVNGSAASQAGVQLNDRVLDVDGRRFASLDDAVIALRADQVEALLHERPERYAHQHPFGLHPHEQCRRGRAQLEEPDSHP